MYAIIETGGKQYCVNENSVIYVEKLDAAEEMLLSALVITDEPKETPPLIADVVR